MTDQVCELRVLKTDLRVLPMRTRFPFRYGIVSLSSLPHLFLEVTVEIDGQVVTALSSEGLAPKWFTKNPDTTTEQDLAEMLAVIQNSCRLALVAGKELKSYHGLWQTLQTELGHWATQQGHPGLLWQLGVSLVERAVLHALCKATGRPMHELIKSERLGIPWTTLLPEIGITCAADFLPAAPLGSCFARHTVGLTDPLYTAEIPEAARVKDGLPQSLEECIVAYGLRYFKIKLSGNGQVDHLRLRSIASLLQEHCGEDYHVTLDGNENYRDISAFREAYDLLLSDHALKGMLKRTLWVEQPLHRDHALAESVATALADWTGAPKLIIDESDGGSGAAETALRLGYSGVSHKNCKGILKGLLNAALIHHQRQLHPAREFILSGEDLAGVGPVALLQDFAMQAVLGVAHVERNGHHYFRGLSMYPPEVGESVLQQFPDLYEPVAEGIASLIIRDGEISLTSVNSAPFGCFEPDVSGLPTLKEWIMQGGMQAL